MSFSWINAKCLAQFTTHGIALWRAVMLQWVVTETYQHTLEHTDEILRLYLWWK